NFLIIMKLFLISWTLIFIILIKQIKSQDCSSASTVWLEWSNWSDCTDTCGSCGIHMRTRICLTNNTNCPCSGLGTQLDYCNLNVCKYPRQTCCSNRTATSYKGTFACLDLSSTGK
uniref:Uncharacterized protein n=1 Tax=Panagrolaimus sp. JU765 TaxID=591449 RepID=A0AC34Q0G3_9BILA